MVRVGGFLSRTSARPAATLGLVAAVPVRRLVSWSTIWLPITRGGTYWCSWSAPAIPALLTGPLFPLPDIVDRDTGPQSES